MSALSTKLSHGGICDALLRDVLTEEVACGDGDDVELLHETF